MTVKEISRRELFNYINGCKVHFLDEKLALLENFLIKTTNCPADSENEVKRILRYFKSDFKQKWTKASYKLDIFLKNNDKWLDGTVSLPFYKHQKFSGRPSKSFEDCSNRSKRRKTEELRKEHSVSELTFAAQMSLRAGGNSNASTVIRNMVSSSDKVFESQAENSRRQKIKDIQPLTVEQSLSVFINANLTRKQYNIIRNASPKVYPCYSLLQKAKEKCYPKKDAYRVTESCSEIKLQDILDHTATRLCEYLDEVLESIPMQERTNLELISKWGCDGSQQHTFKQKFEDSTGNDAYIFQSSFVPIRLCANMGDQKKIIWQNPVPSSPRFCRPIRIRFVHETSEVTKNEIKYINDQIKDLTETEVLGVNLKIKHTLLLTMVDAKVCNAATNTLSTMRCYICNETSKDFNKLNTKREDNPDTFKFGLSILHARIRLFESILHLAYKIPIGKWQARSVEEKQLVKETKMRIQKDLKEKMSLLVDVPKAGLGSTNDGNTSRRFFADVENAANITGVDFDLINKFRIILEVISSGHKVDVPKLAVFCKETARLYVNLYEWHPMTPTVHKILMHGPTIIQHAILPIGQLNVIYNFFKCHF